MDCATRELAGTLKKFKPSVEPRTLGMNNDVTAAFERSGIDNHSRSNRVAGRGFVDMAGDAQVWLNLLDESACGGAADRLAAHDPVAFGLERWRMANHHERSATLP